jgi:hypothetical protein
MADEKVFHIMYENKITNILYVSKWMCRCNILYVAMMRHAKNIELDEDKTSIITAIFYTESFLFLRL